MYFGLFSYYYSSVVVFLLVPDLLIFHERAFRICSNLVSEFAIILSALIQSLIEIEECLSECRLNWPH